MGHPPKLMLWLLLLVAVATRVNSLLTKMPQSPRPCINLERRSCRRWLRDQNSWSDEEEDRFLEQQLARNRRRRIPRSDRRRTDDDVDMAEQIPTKRKRIESIDDDEVAAGSGLVNQSRSVLFSGKSKWQVINRAIVAGMFVAGIGTGITIDSAINTNPKDLASRDAIDRNAPNPRLCAAYGSSAMVLDQRVFITFNPFNVFVTQADTKPGCVLRPANVVAQLQKERPLLTDEEIDSCKNGYNTWAFVGDINNKPQLTCVFQSDDAQNEFLSNPKVGLGEDVYEDDASGKAQEAPAASSKPEFKATSAKSAQNALR